MMTKLQFNQAALNELLRGQNGPVAKHVHKRGRRVEALARRNVDNPRFGSRKPWRRTGDLYYSIFSSYPAIDQGEIAVVVGSDPSTFTKPHHDRDYPFLLERGGVARFIYKRGPNKGKRASKRYDWPWLGPALKSEFERG